MRVEGRGRSVASVLGSCALPGRSPSPVPSGRSVDQLPEMPVESHDFDRILRLDQERGPIVPSRDIPPGQGFCPGHLPGCSARL
jgi:hypothetical protein